MNIKVKRNAFGRQVDSFETEIKMPALGEQPFHAVFIRAPIIEKGEPVMKSPKTGFTSPMLQKMSCLWPRT
jgi:5'-phosphate synthase pdxT subunit